jgi:hypothetical protein
MKYVLYEVLNNDLFISGMLLKDYKQPLYQNVREQSFADTEMFMRA